MKFADPRLAIWTPPACMQKYAISRVTFQRGAGRRVQKMVQNASAYIYSFVVKDVAAGEVGR